MNFDDVVLVPLYRSFGVDAVVTVYPGTTDEQTRTLRVIDQTAGIEVMTGTMSMPSVRPVAMCRRSDLIELGYAIETLIDAHLLVNGSTWTVKNVAPKPGPNGRSSGEVMLILINGDL